MIFARVDRGEPYDIELEYGHVGTFVKQRLLTIAGVLLTTGVFRRSKQAKKDRVHILGTYMMQVV